MRHARQAITLVVPAIALAAIYPDALLPDKIFAGMDFLNMVYPELTVANRSLAQGCLPLWNWYSWGGCPLFATALAALAYPPTWAALALSKFVPLPYCLQISVMAHLAWAGLGVARLAGPRHLDLKAAAGAYAAIAYGGSAFVFGHLEQLPSIATMAWTPWILATLLEALAPGGR